MGAPLQRVFALPSLRRLAALGSAFIGVALAVVALAAPASLGAPAVAHSATAVPSGRTLDDYRHFRIASIDLLGRMPTRQEVAAFERPDFDWDVWVDRALNGPAYSDRMTRIYMDLLRLEPNLNFQSAPSDLLRHEVLGPDGKPVWVYYRENQRRTRPETDGEFCLDPDETGMFVRPRQPDIQSETLKAKPVSLKVLDTYTVLVKPWWLYRDYRDSNPQARFDTPGWKDPDPEYKPVESLLADDGKPVVDVRVCREEASALAVGHVFASGRTKAASPGDTLPGGRLRPLPVDKPYATRHRGEEVACETKMALEYAPDCGCGVGLERCLPGDANNGGSAFYFPNHAPAGLGLEGGGPLDEAKQSQQRWFPYWWSREAVHFLQDLFAGDRDFREILTGRQTFVNGPLAQFYRSIQRSHCCGPEVTFGMLEESEPLFEPSRVPPELEPHDASAWKRVGDRGPHAAGILTMPIFLEKYASARARGAALYNDFLCKSFVPGTQALTPSNEPNLMVRPGCRACHAALEPMAAYFARVEPSNFVFLPSAQFPVRSTTCKLDANGHLNGPCNALYDAAFADAHSATLRSAYGSPQHADETPAGGARDVVATPEFAQCAVQRVATSFLGRPTTPDDDPLLSTLTQRFVRSGYRMKALVHDVLRSDAYARSNDERSP